METQDYEEIAKEPQTMERPSSITARHNFTEETSQIFAEISSDMPRYPRNRSWLIDSDPTDSLKQQFGKKVTGEIMAFLNNHSGAKVLDVGSGNSLGLGSLCQLFGAKIKQASGIDLEPKNQTNLELDLHQGDVVSMPFPDNEFDLIYSSQVFQYVTDKFKGLQEIFRAQKPNMAAYIQFYPNSIVPFRSYEEFLQRNRSQVEELGRASKNRYALLKLHKLYPDEKLIIPALKKVDVWPASFEGSFKTVMSFYN
jgi:SAM-dependent methyltransferase